MTKIRERLHSEKLLIKEIFFNEGYSKSEGNGIGLYIAKNIINSFGGELEAINREDEGLCMMVKLRLFKDV